MLFAEHGASKGYVDLIAGEMEGVKRSQVQRQLRALGLKRGVLAQLDVARLRELYAQHARERRHLDLIATAMGGRFSKTQIAGHLRKLGLRASSPSKRER